MYPMPTGNCPVRKADRPALQRSNQLSMTFWPPNKKPPHLQSVWSGLLLAAISGHELRTAAVELLKRNSMSTKAMPIYFTSWKLKNHDFKAHF